MLDGVYRPSVWAQRYHACTAFEALGAGAAGVGKAAALDTLVPTTNGWTALGDIRVGDGIYSEKGMPYSVVAKSKVWAGRPCYKVTFDDESSLVVDAEHEWLTIDYNARASMRRQEKREGNRTGLNDQRHLVRGASVVTTESIRRTLKHKGKTNHAILLSSPIQMPREDLLIDPYLLGIWLGDGNSRSGQITTADQEVIDEIRRLGYLVNKLSSKYHYGVEGLTSKLRSLGLKQNKNIPFSYLRASEGQRLSLLQGLIDSDGWVREDGRCEIVSIYFDLARDIDELVCSLGMKSFFKAGKATLNGRVIGPKWTIGFYPLGRTVSRLSRKKVSTSKYGRTQRWRYIVSVDPVESVPTQCIQVDSPSHLYLIGENFIPTHNSVCLIMDPLSNILTEHKRCERGEIKWGQSMGNALHLRRREMTLDQSFEVALRLYGTIFPDMKVYKADRIIVFPSGYKIRYSHCYNTYDYNNYMSNAYDHIAFDELIEFEKIQYDNISRRCRTPDPVLRSMERVRAMSNPYQVGGKNERIVVEDPFWVRRYFVDPAPQGGVMMKRNITMSDGSTEVRSRIYLPGRLSDNPDQQFARDYELTLRTGGAKIRKPLLESDWYYTAGSFFDDWDGSMHVVEPFRIPSHWGRFRALDWGFKTYGAVLWFAQDDDGNLYCEKELSYKNMTVDELARNIMLIEKQLGVWGKGKSLITGPADHDLWEERGNVNTEPKIVTFFRHGIRWVKANKRDPMANAQLFIKRLRDHHEGTTLPGIMFFNTCKRCITTIPSIQTHKDNPEEPARGGQDHWYKAASYACAYAGGSVHRGNDYKTSETWDEDDDFRYEPSTSKGHNYGYGIGY